MDGMACNDIYFIINIVQRHLIYVGIQFYLADKYISLQLNDMFLNLYEGLDFRGFLYWVFQKDLDHIQ